MIYITRRVEFCASHRLYNPEFSDEQNEAIYGCCNNPGGHGHNYVLEVTLRGRIEPETGMVMDLKELKQIIEEEIVERVDHKNLNVDIDFLAGVIPTSENIVVSFWQLLEKRLHEQCELHELKLWESNNNLVFYRGEGEQVARHGHFADAAAAK